MVLICVYVLINFSLCFDIPKQLKFKAKHFEQSIKQQCLMY